MSPSVLGPYGYLPTHTYTYRSWCCCQMGEIGVILKIKQYQMWFRKCIRARTLKPLCKRYWSDTCMLVDFPESRAPWHPCSIWWRQLFIMLITAETQQDFPNRIHRAPADPVPLRVLGGRGGGDPKCTPSISYFINPPLHPSGPISWAGFQLEALSLSSTQPISQTQGGVHRDSGSG